MLMITTSQEYKKQITAEIRRVYGRVEIDYTDPFLDQSIEVSANENANISYPQQVTDSITVTYGKIASLDGSWILDGTYVSAPISPTKGQMGWWGNQLAGAGGVFTAPYPTLTVTFNPRPIRQLKVVGDNNRAEYPVDFIVNMYDDDGALVYTETVADNDKVDFKLDYENDITQIAKMELVITKWSHAGRQAKIIEFITSIQEVYEGDDIFSINLVEEREISQGSLPVGNISSNEISISLYNRDRKFDAGKTDSPLYQLLKANRKIQAWLGAEVGEEVEWVPLGVFWSEDWEIPENDIYANTSGRDRLEQLRRTTYANSTVEIDKSLYYLADKILQDAGLSIDEYEIDESLKDIVIPYSYFERQTHREALRLIAEACLGQVYCDRLGKIIITTAQATSTTDAIPTLSVDDELYLLQDGGTEDNTYLLDNGVLYLKLNQLITNDDYFSKQNPVKWSAIANSVKVNSLPLKPTDNLEEVYLGEEQTISAGQTQKTTLFFNETPCLEPEVIVTGATITDVTYYSWGADVTVTSPIDTTYTLKVMARPLRVQGQQTIVKEDAQSILDNGRIEYVYPDNPLVQTRAQAHNIAEKLIGYYANPRSDLTLDWRGNPAWLLGDIVSVLDTNELAHYAIVSQDITWDGALSASMEGRKI
jgi:hypothetical protein